MVRPSILLNLFQVQSVMLTLVTIVELFMPYNFVLAFDKLDITLGGAPVALLTREYVKAPSKSVVVLDGDKLAERKKEVDEEYKSQRTAIKTDYMTVSAYNSIPGQTDASPYRTAVGSLTRDGVVASNHYPIGTRIRFPEYFGDKEFIVEDRMNPRYDKVVDIWMEELSDAKQWGRRYVKIDVVEWGKGRSAYAYSVTK